MKYFLIIYDQKQGRIVELREFDEADRHLALKMRFEREMMERENPNMEVVLLGSTSRETLEQTHGRYFKTVSELAAEGYKLVSGDD